MTIKQVEELLGLDRETVRYYIKEGLVTPKQHANLYREYSEEDVRQLKRIMVLRQLEISIADIRRIMKDELDIRTALESSKKLIEQKQIIVNDAVRICGELIDTDDNQFDPEPYFRNYKQEFAS
jgi:DNA-binding transcriptional MerR regulator